MNKEIRYIFRNFEITTKLIHAVAKTDQKVIKWVTLCEREGGKCSKAISPKANPQIIKTILYAVCDNKRIFIGNSPQMGK
jgi:hypothetical protein